MPLLTHKLNTKDERQQVFRDLLNPQHTEQIGARIDGHVIIIHGIYPTVADGLDINRSAVNARL